MLNKTFGNEGKHVYCNPANILQWSLAIGMQAQLNANSHSMPKIDSGFD
jgi:hypothetical protein